MSDENKNLEKRHDPMLELCKAQGYVPKDCYIAGFVVFALIQKGESPCDGCNLDRKICKGKPKKETRY